MESGYIGYVSTPYGEKNGTDFSRLYKEAIFPAPTVATGETNIRLFREDSQRPSWEQRHLSRIEQFRGRAQTHEWQLRQSIQDNIIASDFIIAVLTDFNPNVMLEVGFAQAQKKIIIYLLVKNQFDNMPSNLANLKRLHLYKTPDNLKLNLYNRIQEAVDDLKRQKEDLLNIGKDQVDYYRDRDAVHLADKFLHANKLVHIITTNLTTVSANYIDQIAEAAKNNSSLEVKILTSDPDNLFIDPRADQLLEDKKGYRMELQGSLESIKAKLKKYKNCEVRTYKDFPVQLWHRIDDKIYVGQSSLVRRTRHNVVFGVSVDTPNIKETYLDHFDHLWTSA